MGSQWEGKQPAVISVHRQHVIGVMGASQCNEQIWAEAYRIGQLIAQRGAILLCGGRGGVMEAAARGARDEGGLTVGILPGTDRKESPPNPFIDIAVFTGMGDARNAINVRSSDVVIALWGGYGTLSEIALALKIGKPVVLLHSWEFKIDPPMRGSSLFIAHTPEEAIQQAADLLGI